jgi:hypothetical protein
MMPPVLFLALALPLSPAETDGVDDPGEAASAATPADGRASGPPRSVDRLLSTADQGVAPRFRIWQSDEYQAFIKPIIQLSTSLTTYLPQSDAENSEFANRVSTLILARIGFEGELFGFVTFRSLFERNLGFSISRNGPAGTGIWEGTASWQARENYIRLQKWGLSLTGGIVPDPASLDYISDNVLDSFGMDPFVRDPLLFSGFNQGQAILLRYSRWGFTAGVGFTGGNPLVTSLSFPFGGEVSQLGSLFSIPFRSISAGFPGSNIHLTLLTPSLTYEDDIFGLKLAGQLYWVDTDVTQEEDVTLRGYNMRATGQVKLFNGALRFFASGAYRENDQVERNPITSALDPTSRDEERFSGAVGAGGADIDFGRIGLGHLGFGGMYYYVYQRLTDEFRDTGDPDDLGFHYINLGLTYWLWDDVVSTGVRWGRFMAESTQPDSLPVLDTVDTVFVSVRLII